MSERTWKEKYRIERAKKSEDDFFTFCIENKISCQKLDKIESEILKKKYLNNSEGNCPDFLIKKENLSCFVEVKTLINFTNNKREKEMDKKREFLQRSHQSGVLVNDIIDITSELYGPFRTFIQSASTKFKNIKQEYLYPRLLLLDGFNVDQLSIHAVLHGSYLSFININNKSECIGFRKNKIGLLDRTGSNISAVIYWNRDQGRYFCVENPKAIIKFSEECFYHFFP